MALTKSDLNQLKVMFEQQTHNFESKLEDLRIDLIEHVDKTIRQSKDDFYTKIDPVLKEVMAAREERTILSDKVYSDHEPRITKVEKKLSLTP